MKELAKTDIDLFSLLRAGNLEILKRDYLISVGEMKDTRSWLQKVIEAILRHFGE